jgi:hypothetical protein
MRNKAMWFRYFMERSGPKRTTLTSRFTVPAPEHPETRESWRMGRPSLKGLRRGRLGR